VNTQTPKKKVEAMSVNFDKKAANSVLTRLDHIAGQIQKKFASWGLSQDVAKAIVNDIDKVADEIESSTFGAGSLAERQVEVLKQAKVLQQDSDEKYMGTFNAPMAPIQTDGDEKYMSAFKDDQSQAVETGKAENGKPLAP